MDWALWNEDVLLVSMDKIKWWLVEESPEGNLLKLSFKIVKENQADANGQLAFTDDMSTFEIVKQVMHSKGVSLNYFKEMKDNEGHLVSFEDKLEDGGDYTIVIAETVEASDSDDEDVVGANND